MRMRNIYIALRAMMLSLMTFVFAVFAVAQKPAGTTVERATLIQEETSLTVQSGSNFIRVDAALLPVAVTYFSETLFGTIPTAIVQDDTIEAEVFFDDCRMGWRWLLTEGETAKIMEVKAHESALLHVKPLIHYIYNKTTEQACDSFVLDGKKYTESGEYILDTVVLSSGERQINSLVLEIRRSSLFEQKIAQYEPYMSPTGKKYETTGDYRDTLSNAAGCDSVVVTHFTLYPTTYNKTTEQACDSFVLNGKKYTKSGEYILDTVVLSSGERQINSLVLEIRRSSLFEQKIAQYEPYMSPTGKKYETTGDYRDTLSNAAGCDSVILTRFTFYPTVYNKTAETACDSYTWQGKSYTVSGLYTDTTKAQDGTRTINTLDLTVNYSSSANITVSQRGAYTSAQGKTYETSGDYKEVITNAAGCDSTIMLHITILGDQMFYDTVYFCRGFNTTHEEQIDEEHVRRYLPYVFESPAVIWDEVMAHAVKAKESTQTQIDLKGAEAELRAYYSGEKTPIETIVWTLRKSNESAYSPLPVETSPQWVSAGKLAAQIHFRCGEIFNNEYPTAVENTEAEAETPVKRIENGKIIIIRGNAVYTPFGQRIK